MTLEEMTKERDGYQELVRKMTAEHYTLVSDLRQQLADVRTLLHLAAGLISTMPGHSSKHPEEVLAYLATKAPEAT